MIRSWRRARRSYPLAAGGFSCVVLGSPFLFSLVSYYLAYPSRVVGRALLLGACDLAFVLSAKVFPSSYTASLKVAGCALFLAAVDRLWVI